VFGVAITEQLLWEPAGECEIPNSQSETNPCKANFLAGAFVVRMEEGKDLPCRCAIISGHPFRLDPRGKVSTGCGLRPWYNNWFAYCRATIPRNRGSISGRILKLTCALTKMTNPRLRRSLLRKGLGPWL